MMVTAGRRRRPSGGARRARHRGRVSSTLRCAGNRVAGPCRWCPVARRSGLVFYEGAGTAPVAGVAGGGVDGSMLLVSVREMLVVSGAQMEGTERPVGQI